MRYGWQHGGDRRRERLSRVGFLVLALTIGRRSKRKSNRLRGPMPCRRRANSKNLRRRKRRKRQVATLANRGHESRPCCVRRGEGEWESTNEAGPLAGGDGWTSRAWRRSFD